MHRWFASNSSRGWATCPMTQAAFVRILSNPAFAERAVSPADALVVLAASLEHPDHRFWSDEISVPQALHHFSRHLQGHRQVTDAYLLGLVIQKKGRLVTLDAGIPSLLRDD